MSEEERLGGTEDELMLQVEKVDAGAREEGKKGRNR